MNIESNMLSEVSLTEKAKNHMISLVCWDIKQKAKMNKQNQQTHRHRQQYGVLPEKEGVGENEEGKGGLICSDRRIVDF